MKKIITWTALLVVTGSILTACNDQKEEVKKPAIVEKTKETSSVPSSAEHDTEKEEKTTQPIEKEKSILTNYSAKEIEYARVWLEVIGNKETNELNVSYVSAGSPVNPYEEQESAVYPKNVVYLAGQSMADGGVTYSSNGNGTINLYDVPSHWQTGVVPEGQTMKEYTEEIINHPKIVSIPTGNDEEVVEMIKKLHIEN